MDETLSLNENNSPNKNDKKELTKFGKFINALKSYFSKPSNVILVIFAIILSLTVIVPLISCYFLRVKSLLIKVKIITRARKSNSSMCLQYGTKHQHY